MTPNAYLHIQTHKCQRCSQRWTTSALTTSWGFPLSGAIAPETLSGYFHTELHHQMCFNCLPPATPELPLNLRQPKTERQRQVERKLQGGFGASSPKAAVTDDEILGD